MFWGPYRLQSVITEGCFLWVEAAGVIIRPQSAMRYISIASRLYGKVFNQAR